MHQEVVGNCADIALPARYTLPAASVRKTRTTSPLPPNQVPASSDLPALLLDSTVSTPAAGD